MTDFEIAGKALRSAGRRRKAFKVFVIIIIFLLVIAFFNRKKINEVLIDAKDHITAVINDKMNEIKGEFKSSKRVDNSLENMEKADENLENNVVKCVLSNDDIIELEKIKPVCVEAESELISAKGKDYSANMIIDEDVKTAWQEGEEDFGLGKSILIQFEKTKLNYIVIYNGNQSNEKAYKKNNRLKAVSIIINEEINEIELEDSMEPQVIRIEGADDVSEVKLEIQSVYEGTAFNDTCIAEIECY